MISFNNDNSANFSGEKKYNEEFRGVYFLTKREKSLKLSLVLVSFLFSSLKVSNINSTSAHSQPVPSGVGKREDLSNNDHLLDRASIDI